MNQPVDLENTPKPCAACHAQAWSWLLALLVLPAGCARQAAIEYVASKEVQELDPKVQVQVREQLEKHCGTPARPKLIGGKAEAAHLQRGAQIYQRRCAACHGNTGDGEGPAATHLYPRPRDYRRGTFKFTSTPYGAKPRRDDLMRTLREGAPGTSMPSFALLPQEELDAVLDYVLVLTHRGELELLLALEAQAEDRVDPEIVPGLVESIVAQWKQAENQTVYPETRMPPFSQESVELGRKAFLTEEAGCFKCHGNDGRGLTTENLKGFVDAWNFPTRAADLTSGMLHGGREPEDIYRRIYSGINGTPMPSFQLKLAAQPETFWHLVHYVQHIANTRRAEVVAGASARAVSEPANSQAAE